MVMPISGLDCGGVGEAIRAKETSRSLPVTLSSAGSAITISFDGAADSGWRRSNLASR
jgi:hypothetical protein